MHSTHNKVTLYFYIFLVFLIVIDSVLIFVENISLTAANKTPQHDKN